MMKHFTASGPVALLLILSLVVTGAVFASGEKEPDTIVTYEAPPRQQPPTANPQEGLSVLEAMQNQNRYVAQQVLPVVVEVNVVDIIRQDTTAISPFNFFFGPHNGGNTQPREFRQQGLGSGVIVGRSDGTVYVVTNNHVVEKADEIGVSLYDGRKYEAQIVGTDPRKDLALISFETDEEVPVAVLGDSDALMVGDFVFAVGNPLGFESTVTSGIVSALGRRAANMPSFTDYIQTDAAINQGNSGGALVNLHGEVVGINSWIASNSGGSIGLGFAIPINTVKGAIKDFIESGAVEYGWLGITVGTLNDETKQEMGYAGMNGGFVFNVVEDSPAEKAGILPGDFITRIGEEDVGDANELTIVVGNLAPGETRRFQIERLGTSLSIDVTIGLRDEEKVAAGLNVWPGLSVVTINDAMREQAGLPKDAGNVVVGSVEPNSPADIAGIRGGDVIKAIDGKPLENMRDFYKLLNENSRGKIEFTIFRRGAEITIGMSRR